MESMTWDGAEAIQICKEAYRISHYLGKNIEDVKAIVVLWEGSK